MPQPPSTPPSAPSGLLLDVDYLTVPNVPATSNFCSAYRDGTGAGGILYQICMNTPTGNGKVGQWGDCARGKLLDDWTPNDNPLHLIFGYGFKDHIYDLTYCSVY